METKTAEEKPKVLFFHCILGADRTGCLAASYLLKKAKLGSTSVTLQQAIQAGKDAVGITPNEGYLRLTIYYCKSIFADEPARCTYTP
jgi:protein-tyrosine phosphatase